MELNILTIVLACMLIICPGAAPVYDSLGFDTAEIIQTAEEIAGHSIQTEVQNPKPQETNTPAVQPTQTTNPPATNTPTKQPTLSPTPNPTAAYIPTQIPAADKAGSNLLAGNWYGTKSLFFGMASAEFYLTANPDGTMKISGTANAPSAGYNNAPFSVNADWTYLGGNSFTGTADGKEISFTCDGNQVSLTANPYALGLIDSSIANMDIAIAMNRI